MLWCAVFYHFAACLGIAFSTKASVTLSKKLVTALWLFLSSDRTCFAFSCLVMEKRHNMLSLDALSSQNILKMICKQCAINLSEL